MCPPTSQRLPTPPPLNGTASGATAEYLNRFSGQSLTPGILRHVVGATARLMRRGEAYGPPQCWRTRTGSGNGVGFAGGHHFPWSREAVLSRHTSTALSMAAASASATALGILPHRCYLCVGTQLSTQRQGLCAVPLRLRPIHSRQQFSFSLCMPD